MTAPTPCSRCGQDQIAPQRVFLPKDLLQQVLMHSCQSCWKEWLGQQTKLINELRLNVSNSAAHELLGEHMSWFLKLPGAKEPGTNVALPPEADGP